VIEVQIWFDIFPDPAKPDQYQWRVVLDSLRNLFTVLDAEDQKTSFRPTTVALRDNLYYFSDIPTRLGVFGNLVIRILPTSVEVISGGGAYKHVLWARGRKKAEKDFGLNWEPAKYSAVLPSLLQSLKLVKYSRMVDTEVYRG